MPTIQQLVQLRPEVAQGHLHGIVSLYALLDAESSNAFELNPTRVLEATYPSVTLGVNATPFADLALRLNSQAIAANHQCAQGLIQSGTLES